MFPIPIDPVFSCESLSVPFPCTRFLQSRRERIKMMRPDSSRRWIKPSVCVILKALSFHAVLPNEEEEDRFNAMMLLLAQFTCPTDFCGGTMIPLAPDSEAKRPKRWVHRRKYCARSDIAPHQRLHRICMLHHIRNYTKSLSSESAAKWYQDVHFF